MSLRIVAALSLLTVQGFAIHAQAQTPGVQGFFRGGTSVTPAANIDPKKPVDRGYITVETRPAEGGAIVRVQVMQSRLNSPVVLSLQVPISDPSSAEAQQATVQQVQQAAQQAFSALWGNSLAGFQTPAAGSNQMQTAQSAASHIQQAFVTKLQASVGSIQIQPGTKIVTLKLLTLGKPNSNSFIQTFEFKLNYRNIQDKIRQLAPNAKGLIFDAGTTIFVKADFPQMKGDANAHNWGGYDRGGTAYLPPALDSMGRTITVNKAPVGANGTPLVTAARRPEVLDLAIPVTREMGNIFNNLSTGAGLKTNGGQIRSRLEGEGKYQLTQAQLLEVRQLMIELANDPAKLAAVLGPDWTLKLEERYMQKDATGATLKDAQGISIPDPMIDTYYDGANYEGASRDLTLRYRWTEGNRAGAWNLKVGMGRITPDSIVYRVEYGIDTTDDKPESIAKFADSFHPLNPFSQIRTLTGLRPSELLHPSIKLTDYRHKFKLEHKGGLALEISVDDVHAEDLRHGSTGVRFAQLEMDIDHLSTSSANVMQDQGNATFLPNHDFLGRYTDTPQAKQSFKEYMQGLTSSAFFDGKPVIHEQVDLDENSTLLTSRAADFNLAAQAIVGLRNHVLGNNWRPGAGKYAFAAAAFGYVENGIVSPSVKPVEDMLAAAAPQGPSCTGALTP